MNFAAKREESNVPEMFTKYSRFVPQISLKLERYYGLRKPSLTRVRLNLNSCNFFANWCRYLCEFFGVPWGASSWCTLWCIRGSRSGGFAASPVPDCCAGCTWQALHIQFKQIKFYCFEKMNEPTYVRHWPISRPRRQRRTPIWCAESALGCWIQRPDTAEVASSGSSSGRCRHRWRQWPTCAGRPVNQDRNSAESEVRRNRWIRRPCCCTSADCPALNTRKSDVGGTAHCVN